MYVYMYTKMSLGWNKVSGRHTKQCWQLFCWHDNAFFQYMLAIAAFWQELEMLSLFCAVDGLVP